MGLLGSKRSVCRCGWHGRDVRGGDDLRDGVSEVGVLEAGLGRDAILRVVAQALSDAVDEIEGDVGREERDERRGCHLRRVREGETA